LTGAGSRAYRGRALSAPAMASSDCPTATSFPPSTNSRRRPFHRFVLSVDEESMEAVLRGDLDSLMAAFCWIDSPQGHKYWRRLHAGEVPLSDSDKRMLVLWIIIGAMPIETVFDAEDYHCSNHAARLRGVVEHGGVKALDELFTWNKTCQGHDYWQDRRYRGVPLSHADKEWLLALAELHDRIEQDRSDGIKQPQGTPSKTEAKDDAADEPVQQAAQVDEPVQQAAVAKRELEAAISKLLATFCREHNASLDELDILHTVDATGTSLIEVTIDAHVATPIL